MTLTELLIPTYRQMLQALAVWLRKAEAQVDDADALARIDEALAFLHSLAPDALDAGAGQPLALELPMGIAFDLDGDGYARDWALSQFYFHLMTAYAILRNQGVELGKADYVQHMFAFLRPRTAPAG